MSLQLPVTRIGPFGIYWPILVLSPEENLYGEKIHGAEKYFENNFRLNYIETNFNRNEVQAFGDT